MKKLKLISIGLFIGTVTTILINGCAPTQMVASKSGSQLWGENCIRCHNAPPSSDYSGAQWETIGMHMKMRANTTDDEIQKIVAFLKTAE